MQIIKKYMERGPVLGSVQIKTIARYHFTPTRMAPIRRTSRCQRGVEKRLLCFAGEKAECCGKQSDSSTPRHIHQRTGSSIHTGVCSFVQHPYSEQLER